jgi:uncharacterized protein
MNRRQFLTVGGQLLLGGVLVSALPPLYATQVEPRWLDVVQTTLAIPALSPALEGLTVVQLSDIHLGPHLKPPLQRAIALANAQAPDLVVLTGDFVTAEARYSREVADMLAHLRARYKVYAVLGNHDIWTDADVVARNLESVGIVVLRNAREPIEVKGTRLWVLGIEDMGYTGNPGQFSAFQSYWEPRARVLSTLVKDLPTDELRLLLVHNPDFTEMLPDQGIAATSVHLALSGHTHGGQLRLPILGPLFIPSCFGPRFIGGLVQGKSTQVYVSRGIGTTGLRLRFNARPEVSVLRLIAATPRLTG